MFSNPWLTYFKVVLPIEFTNSLEKRCRAAIKSEEKKPPLTTVIALTTTTNFAIGLMGI